MHQDKFAEEGARECTSLLVLPKRGAKGVSISLSNPFFNWKGIFYHLSGPVFCHFPRALLPLTPSSDHA
jgi:hypothetical protein